MIALLEHYSNWVGEKAIDAAKKDSPKFVPSVPEVGKACEAIIGQTRGTITWAQDWDRRARQQLEDRRKLEEQKEPPSQELIDRIRDEMAGHGMFILGAEKAHSITVESVKARFGITDAQWDAIPAAPVECGYWQGLRQPTGETSAKKPSGDATREAEEREWRDHMASR